MGGEENQIQASVKRNVPTRRRRNRNRPAWLSKEILTAIRRKKRLWTRVREGNNRELYDEEEKKVKKMIRNAKRKFEKKLAEGGKKDSTTKRQFYAYVKQKTKA